MRVRVASGVGCCYLIKETILSLTFCQIKHWQWLTESILFFQFRHLSGSRSWNESLCSIEYECMGLLGAWSLLKTSIRIPNEGSLLAHVALEVHSIVALHLLILEVSIIVNLLISKRVLIVQRWCVVTVFTLVINTCISASARHQMRLWKVVRERILVLQCWRCWHVGLHVVYWLEGVVGAHVGHEAATWLK